MTGRRSEVLPTGVLVACTALVLGLAAAVAVVVGGESLAFLLDGERHITVDLTALALGTVRISAVAIAVATPLGFAVAVTVRELTPQVVRAPLRSWITLFATMPPIVFAYSALALERSTHTRHTAAVTLGVMLAPFVARLFDNAVRRAPERLRDAALALGATRLEAWVRVVLPTAASSLASAVVLVMVRAIGESVIVALASIDTPATLAAEPMRAALDTGVGLAHHEIFVIGGVLVVITLSLHRLALFLAPRERT